MEARLTYLYQCIHRWEFLSLFARSLLGAAFWPQQIPSAYGTRLQPADCLQKTTLMPTCRMKPCRAPYAD
jgi:hypothetical protein